MPEAQLLHELIEVSAHRTPTAAALILLSTSWHEQQAAARER